MAWNVNLGDKVRDKITGMTGIVTSRTEHLYGCNHLWVNPQELKDGKPVEGAYFDEDRVEVLERSVIKPTPAAVRDNPGSVAGLPPPRSALR